jgi:hypothetical protein
VISTGDRRRELAAYAVIGFGGTLLAYGTVFKTQHWLHSMGSLLSVLGVSLALTAIRGLRTLPADRVKPSTGLRVLAAGTPAVVAALGLYALNEPPAAAVGSLALHDRQAGGVTIALPEGNDQPNPDHASKLIVELGGQPERGVGVVWQRGTFNDDSAKAMAASGAAKAGAPPPERLPDAAFRVGEGIEHRSFQVVQHDLITSITVFACGPRLFTVFTAGDGALDLARRVLATVRCDPAADPVPAIPAIVDLPSEWQPTASAPSELDYVKDNETIVVTLIDIVANDEMQGAIESAARQMGPEARLGARHEVTGPDGSHSIWGGTITHDGVSVPFQLATWPCVDRGFSLVVIHAGGPDEQTGMALFGHVHCAPRGASAPAGSAAR